MEVKMPAGAHFATRKKSFFHHPFHPSLNYNRKQSCAFCYKTKIIGR
jgi:hypothetical protein